MVVPDALPFPKNIMSHIGQMAAVATDVDEDEGLKHFEQVGQGRFFFLLYKLNVWCMSTYRPLSYDIKIT